MTVLKKYEQRDNIGKTSRHKKIFVCTELRRLALVYSLIIFFITAVMTICVILANTHTQTVLDLIKSDIHEEEERTELYYGERGQNSNESKLFRSKLFVTRLSRHMTICTWIVCADLVAAGVLIYGVFYKSSSCMLPWIGLGFCLYICSVGAMILMYLGVITFLVVSSKVIWAALLSIPIFTHIFITLIRYYHILRYNELRNENENNKKVYEAYGGYKHTIEKWNSNRSII